MLDLHEFTRWGEGGEGEAALSANALDLVRRSSDSTRMRTDEYAPPLPPGPDMMTRRYNWVTVVGTIKALAVTKARIAGIAIKYALSVIRSACRRDECRMSEDEATKVAFSNTSAQAFHGFIT